MLKDQFSSNIYTKTHVRILWFVPRPNSHLAACRRGPGRGQGLACKCCPEMWLQIGKYSGLKTTARKVKKQQSFSGQAQITISFPSKIVQISSYIDNNFRNSWLIKRPLASLPGVSVCLSVISTQFV